MKIVFIVSGEDVVLVARKHELLVTVMGRVLEQTHNTGRPVGEWAAVTPDGRPLDTARTVKEMVPPPSQTPFGEMAPPRIFLLLRPPPDPRDAELARLRAEVATLRRERDSARDEMETCRAHCPMLPRAPAPSPAPDGGGE